MLEQHQALRLARDRDTQHPPRRCHLRNVPAEPVGKDTSSASDGYRVCMVLDFKGLVFVYSG
jgi:hypothetical protein